MCTSARRDLDLIPQPGARNGRLRRAGSVLTALWFGLLMMSLPAVAQTSAGGSIRERLSLNADWRFQKSDPADAGDQLKYDRIKERVLAASGDLKPGRRTGGQTRENLGGQISYVQAGFDDSGWRRLNLPHDWGVESQFKQEYPGETGKLLWWGVGWYRKHLEVAAAEKGKQIYLDLDGAMAYALVWLNGRFVGGWPYGYSSFRLDLTPYLKYGADNVIAIRLDNPPDSSRWYPGGGIYRNVWLVKTSPVHVAHWGTTVTTPEVTRENATVDVKVEIDNRADADADLTVRTQLFELGADGRRGGKPVASSTPVNLKIPAGESRSEAVKIAVKSPRLWDLQTHRLYAALTRIEQKGQVVDSYETIFGIRTIKFEADRGFLLNGQHVRLNGVCNHHDLGPLGTAVSRRALERQIELLKEMGANAIRTSHNPPSPELLELCDRMGMVVIAEAFDCWKKAKKPNDYHLLFEDWHEQDLRALLRRDRNHPSVILWSIGNEIWEQGGAEGLKISNRLAQIVHEEDPTRLATAACHVVGAGYNGFQKTLDVFGYNYKPFEYQKFRTQNPTIPLIASETSSCVSSRGEYFFPVSNDKKDGRAEFQVSSYDLYAPPWATPPDDEFKGQDENPTVGGEFVWTGFDYLGEPTPFDVKGAPSRSSYFGIMDLCGFKKDRFYSYQARWRPELPMVHIFPHWNWADRKGEVTPVHVYTSGDEAELFLNGKSLGRKKRESLQYRLRWDDVKYEPGELKVVSYKRGLKWAEGTTKTTGPAARVSIRADRSTINADGHDLSYLTVAIADKDGVTVPRSNNLVRFEISGPGEIAAVDNGDATSHAPFQAREGKAYNGLVLVIVRSKAGVPGTITLKAVSEGLTAAEIRVKSK
ncbi:MAG TPA: beta-galactosidase GalB [Blastocatellia bacterium]|nr:beta-galactosidase GalB [Blastocatellia bacterium]